MALTLPLLTFLSIAVGAPQGAQRYGEVHQRHVLDSLVPMDGSTDNINDFPRGVFQRHVPDTLVPTDGSTDGSNDFPRGVFQATDKKRAPVRTDTDVDAQRYGEVHQGTDKKKSPVGTDNKDVPQRYGEVHQRHVPDTLVPTDGSTDDLNDFPRGVFQGTDKKKAPVGTDTDVEAKRYGEVHQRNVPDTLVPTDGSTDDLNDFPRGVFQ